MSKLYIRGINKPIIITLSQAKNIGKVYDDESVSPKTKLNIEGTRFLKEDIKNIIENDVEDTRAELSDNKRTENDKYYEDVSKEYTRMIIELCNKSVESKANDTRLYELAWSGFTLSPVTQEFLQEVKKRQRAFYEKHPKYPYASINVVDLLPKEKAPKDSIREIMPSYISKKILAMIDEAYRTARYSRMI